MARVTLWSLLAFVCFLAVFWHVVAPSPILHESSVRALAGARIRVVWVQHDGSDMLAATSDLILMGLDSDDGRGERSILEAPANYTKPLLTPDGDRVVFSRRATGDIHIVNFDGSGARRLAHGFALDVWSDPATGALWIYAGRGRVGDAFQLVERFLVDKPDRAELVWDRTLVGEDTFQVSRDGQLAGGMFPWPQVGVSTLPNGKLRHLGDGCWTALSHSDSPMFWFLDNAHRNLTFVELAGGRRWSVAITGAPGFEGAEAYHPRWLRDPRLLLITGPFNLGGRNQVRTGGPQVDIFLGRFNADFSTVEGWTRVTDNVHGDAYPDAWIAPVAGVGEAQSADHASLPTADVRP